MGILNVMVNMSKLLSVLMASTQNPSCLYKQDPLESLLSSTREAIVSNMNLCATLTLV